MGEFSELVGIRNEYYEYTDEVCELVKAETSAINEAYLADLIEQKLLTCLDNEYPLTSLIVLRLTHHEIVNHITDKSFVNIRRDISEKIVTRVTGKSAIMTQYSGTSDDIKKRRAMMNMIGNYMFSMYMSDDKSEISLMEKGILKSLESLRKQEECIKGIEVTSHKSGNPTQGIIFTITFNIE